MTRATDHSCSWLSAPRSISLQAAGTQAAQHNSVSAAQLSLPGSCGKWVPHDNPRPPGTAHRSQARKAALERISGRVSGLRRAGCLPLVAAAGAAAAAWGGTIAAAALPASDVISRTRLWPRRPSRRAPPHFKVVPKAGGCPGPSLTLLSALCTTPSTAQWVETLLLLKAGSGCIHHAALAGSSGALAVADQAA